MKTFKNRILDTHLFYETAGLLDQHLSIRYTLKDLIKNCDRLALTPLNVIEILATVTEGNFLQKQKIVKEFIKIPFMFTGPDNYFRSAWGLKEDKDEDNHILFALNRFLDSKEFKPIEEETNYARKEKMKVYNGFAESVIETMDTLFPGYKEARINKKMITPEMKVKKDLEEIIFSDAGYNRILITTKSKLPEFNGVIESTETTDQIERAKNILDFYIRMYRGYLLKSLSTAPEPNDFGDLEQMIYLSSNCQFVTREKKWLKIAEENNLKDYVIHPDFL